MSEFDGRAQGWDKDMVHVKRSEAIATAMLDTLPIRKKMTALEYGAGTGLLSFILKDRFSEITMLDNSRDMVRVAQEKIAAADIHHMRAFFLNLETEDFPEKVDVVFSQMVMHHVEDVQKVFKKFYSLLNPGGYLAIADLYSEDGSFHGDGFTGHCGFDCDQLVIQLQGIGFSDVSYKQCYVLNKVNEGGIEKLYPIFLLTASL